MANKKLAMEVFNNGMNLNMEIEISYNGRDYHIELVSSGYSCCEVGNDVDILDDNVYIFKDKQDILDNYIIQGKPLKNIMGQLDNIWS